MYINKFTSNYFLVLFSLIPVSILIGPSISLTNVLLIDLSFIVLIIYKKDFNFLKSKPIKYLLALYLYLFFNSFISIDNSISHIRNFGFLRFIILFAAFNYFFLENSFYKKVLIFWLITIFIVSIDVYIEQLSGTNIFGYNYGVRFLESDGGRIIKGRVVSFFKDEPIVGGYLLGFVFIVVGFILDQKKNKTQYINLLLIIFFMFSILFTGERANTIRAILGLILFILLINEINIKLKIISIIAIILVVSFSILNIKYLKIRFLSQINSIYTKHTIYFDIYKSGIQVFKNNKLFGIGNKNYRVETCKKANILKAEKGDIYYCQNHPHQIYLELLSEHGLLGSFIILFILFKLAFSRVIDTFLNNNYLKIGSLINLLIIFIPLLPTGSFFGDFLLTIFMINLSIFYASDKKMNIFNYHNYR